MFCLTKVKKKLVKIWIYDFFFFVILRKQYRKVMGMDRVVMCIVVLKRKNYCCKLEKEIIFFN